MSSTTISVADSDFQAEVLDADRPVLVDFWAPWCGPCRIVGPILEELAEERSGEIVVAKVNTDINQATAARLGIQGIPTMILFKNGQEVDRVVGAVPKAALDQWIDSTLA